MPVRSNGTDALAATRATGRELPPIDSSDEQPLSMLFFDTEGFESTGQSDAYDDRIFAFAAILGSTLIYNLAEAVRESDIEKLAFAVELATAFYPHYNTSECSPIHSCQLFVCVHQVHHCVVCSGVLAGRTASMVSLGVGCSTESAAQALA